MAQAFLSSSLQTMQHSTWTMISFLWIDDKDQSTHMMDIRTMNIRRIV
ncbi:hypothetical protein [Halobacillus faecis]|nr:hypothetical protein [Halobacillus faecis]